MIRKIMLVKVGRKSNELERHCNDMPTRYTGTTSPLGFWEAVAINMGWFG
jgi:hypothetical protein